MNPAFSAGTLPAWRHPIRTHTGLGDIDTLVGDYKCARTTTLAAGDAVPGYPGMRIISLGEIDSGISHEYAITAEGSLAGTYATKRLNQSETRSLGPNFETFTERKISWHTGRKAITGVSATGVLTSAAHGFSDTQRIVILTKTGGSSLTAQSATVAPVVYYIRDATTDTFKLAATSGGSAVALGSDISAGYILAAEFCPGTVHPDWPAMYLVSVSLSDTNTPWRTADCQYAGMLWAKPYHRTITVNGQQFSSSEPITVDLASGWPSDPRYSNFHLPEIVVTDITLETGALATSSIPAISTPPDAPSIMSLSLTGADSLFIWNYPFGWSLMAVDHVETLNAKISVSLTRATYRYIWPKIFK